LLNPWLTIFPFTFYEFTFLILFQAMNARKLSDLAKILFITSSILASATMPANAELLIGISFPSQGGGDNDVVVDFGGKPLLTSSSLNNTTNGLGISSTFSLMNPALFPGRIDEVVVVTEPESSASVSTSFILFESTNIGVLTATLKQNILQLDWPSDRIGWILQTQTNSPGAPFSSEWFRVLGSSTTNHLNLPLDRANTSVFFRLVAP
jgi:hypothetical protein